MIAVIFEVWPKAEHKQEYLETGAAMGPLAEAHDGFVSIERFESLTEPGKVLSLSVFRDEDSLNAWRRQAEHRIAQSKGRSKLFDNYRLRVTSIIRDYGMHERDQAPDDSRVAHDDAERAVATAR